MVTARPVRSHYSESEAAEALGVTIERLRELVRKHIIQNDEDLANLPSTHYQRSDLLLLRLLVQRSPSALTQD